MQDQQDITRDESADLISADKVHGTAVYDPGGERMGTIDSVMLKKREGEVAYAIMSFGGFLGIGEKYHPLPWDALEYDTQLGGYCVRMGKEQLRDAPSFDRNEFDRDGWRTRTDDYYGRAGMSGRAYSAADRL